MSLITDYHPKRTGYQKRDPRMVRLRNPETGHFLHLRGVGEVPDTTYAWLGYAYQAETMRARATRQGQGWPYQVVKDADEGKTI